MHYFIAVVIYLIPVFVQTNKNYYFQNLSLFYYYLLYETKPRFLNLKAAKKCTKVKKEIKLDFNYKM